ncbi:MAG: 2-oxo acid dehydrogenase subunit E2 [Acidobacteria bacterium]|nr:2-oxo acid dehydrogenase subunit E2 [Acidobacteriota bacterium]
MRRDRLSGWRRVATAAWSAPDNPQFFGAIDIEAAAVLEFIERARAAGRQVTPTHLVGRAVARALAAVPDVNVRIVRGRVIPNPTVDVFFVVAIDGNKSLSGVKVERADAKNVYEIATELATRARLLKEGKDKDFSKAKLFMDGLPWPLPRFAIRFASWLAGDRGMSIRTLGITPRPFGSAMVTSVGMFGLPVGFAPLSPMYRMPILVAVAEIVEKPVAVDGRVVTRWMLPIGGTFDHRYFDGWHIAELLKPFREYLANPGNFEPAPGGGE